MGEGLWSLQHFWRYVAMQCVANKNKMRNIKRSRIQKIMYPKLQYKNRYIYICIEPVFECILYAIKYENTERRHSISPSYIINIYLLFLFIFFVIFLSNNINLSRRIFAASSM